MMARHTVVRAQKQLQSSRLKKPSIIYVQPFNTGRMNRFYLPD